MSVDALRVVCDTRSVRKIAMIDDVFDAPATDGLDLARYNNFRRQYNSDDALRQSVARVSGMVVEALPGLGDLEEEQLEPIWRSVWKPRVGGRRTNSEHASQLSELFLGHHDDVLGMLDTVVKLIGLFRIQLERKVSVHGTDFDPEQVSKADIVVVDYFLGVNLSNDEAFEKALDTVSRIVKAAKLPRRSVPSFLLVSSRSDEIDIDQFRDGAKLMKSRFRFFPKAALRPDSPEEMVNLHDLIDASDRTAAVEHLVDDWEEGVRRSIDAVKEFISTLDVSDLVYLDCFRLTHEGTSIANYLRWFLTSSLSARVTAGLTRKIWSESEGVKLFSVTDDMGELDHGALITTFDGPSDAIAQAYGEILFDTSRGRGEAAFPARIRGHDLVEGDVFVRPKGRDRQGYDKAEVRLIMTRSSELRRRGIDNKIGDANILLLPGTLHKVVQEDKNNNFANGSYVRVLERGEWSLLRVDWKFREPISVEWSKMRKEGPGGPFVRLGRVRELYFHRIREEFVGNFSRVGTEVAPLLPHAREGEVWVAIQVGGKRQHKRVMKFGVEDQLVWEMGPFRQTGKQTQIYVYQSSRKFLVKLQEYLRELCSERPEWAESIQRNIAHLSNMKTYMDLVRPMPLGVRGENGVVEVKKSKKPSGNGVKSRADLVVVTFFE